MTVFQGIFAIKIDIMILVIGVINIRPESFRVKILTWRT